MNDICTIDGGKWIRHGYDMDMTNGYGEKVDTGRFEKWPSPESCPDFRQLWCLG